MAIWKWQHAFISSVRFSCGRDRQARHDEQDEQLLKLAPLPATPVRHLHDVLAVLAWRRPACRGSMRAEGLARPSR